MTMPDRDSHDDWRDANPPLLGWGTAIPVRYGEPTVAADPDWSDYENSDPFADVAVGLETFRAYHGRPPAKLVISPRLARALLGHPLERLKLTEPGTLVTPALLAQLFDVADVIVV